jgi:RimJ/RimL family protein N-acetyltransferase
MGQPTNPPSTRVSLRPVVESDLPIFFEEQRDPIAVHMSAVASRDERAFAAHWVRILGDSAIAKRTILVDGSVAGYLVSFERMNRMEVGYWIGRRYWGQGIATRGLSQFLDHVRTRPLYGRVAKDNQASIRVLEKCGFEITGEERAFMEARGEEVEGYILTLGGAEDSS